VTIAPLVVRHERNSPPSMERHSELFPESVGAGLAMQDESQNLKVGRPRYWLSRRQTFLVQRSRN